MRISANKTDSPGGTGPSPSGIPPLSPSQRRYLLSVYELGCDGSEVRCRDIARALGVKRPSVSRMLQSLVEAGLIDKEYYGTVRFTETGVRTAGVLYTRYILLHSLLSGKFHLSEAAAENDAVACICSLSEEGLEKISDAAVRLALLTDL